MFVELTIFAFVLFVSYFVWNRIQELKVRDRLGIPGPKTNFFFGNMNQIMANGKIHPDHAMGTKLKEWRSQYGDYFGYYLGPRLIVVLFDLHLAKQVFIKQFDCFVDRMRFVMNERPIIRDSLVHATGDKWKHIRSSVTPTFTASKMKQMSLTIHDKLDTLLNKLQNFANQKETFDIYDAFQGLTLDVIGQCAFAVKVNCQTDPNDQFLVHCKKFFQSADIKENALLPLALFFPEFNKLWTPLNRFTNIGKEETWLIDILQKVVDERKKNFKSFNSVDVLQLLLEQRESEAAEVNGHGAEDGRKSRTLTDNAILGNAFIFLLAGYETTSTALGFTAWLMAKHRDVQSKLQKEIDEKVSPIDIVNYDVVHKLPYLDAVYHEALRIYPPVVQFLTRTCVKECDIGPIHFMPGMQVNVPNYEIHHDPDVWPEPEKFDPERFMNTNTSIMSWLPFGVGPRNCVGMRFADMEYKMAMVRILSKFNIVFAPDSEVISVNVESILYERIFLSVYKQDPLKTMESSLLMRPKNGVRIRVEKR